MRAIRCALLSATLAGSAAAALAQTTYADRAAFLAAAGAVTTDDYQSGYTPFVYVSDAAMTAVKNLTAYASTGFNNSNIVVGNGGELGYCAGCNGSFRLGFTTAAFGGAGTNAVAFDYVNVPDFSGPATPYFAYVTFVNGSHAVYRLETQASVTFPLPDFFGLTSALAVTSIDIGLSDGNPTRDGGFVLDNLSVAVSAVPEPAAMALLLIGLVAIGARRSMAS